MSAQSALNFIQKIQKDERLKSTIRAMGPEIDLEDIVAIGAEAGFTFTAEEFRTAFAGDWIMRRFFYSARSTDS